MAAYKLLAVLMIPGILYCNSEEMDNNDLPRKWPINIGSSAGSLNPEEIVQRNSTANKNLQPEVTNETSKPVENSSLAYFIHGNSMTPEYFSLEESTNTNGISQENATETDTSLKNSTETDYISLENSTTADGISRENSTMENSTQMNDITKVHGWPANTLPNTSSQESNVTMASLDDAKMAVRIWLYGSPILIVGGTLGNVLSFTVMLRKKIRNSTTSLYLLVLSVVDTVVLYTGLLRLYIKHSSGYDIRHSSSLACKFHLFGVYACQQFDSWILVSVTLERVCAVFLPHKSKEIFTKQFATVSLIIQALVIIIINSNFFYTHDLLYFRDLDGRMEPICFPPLQEHLSYISNVWPWIDFCLFSLMPFAIILTSNVAIVCRLLWSRYARRRHLRATHDVKMTSMTAILITVSIVFFVTTAPISIFLILSAMLHQDADIYQQAFMSLIWAVLNMILYTNNAVNFLLYCFSGPRFRRELKVMFFRRNIVHPLNTTTIIELQHG